MKPESVCSCLWSFSIEAGKAVLDYRNSNGIQQFNISAIMKAAQHKPMVNAATYFRDSFALYDWTKFTKEGTLGLLKNDILIWEDIFI